MSHKTAHDSETNRPRNLLVTDATTPVVFSFRGRYGTEQSFTVQQWPDEDTWPGGALWDLGLIMAQLIVKMSGGMDTRISMGIDKLTKSKSLAKQPSLPDSLRCSHEIRNNLLSKDGLCILELGCGVGLTGIVAASCLGAKLTLLTDLVIVVDKCTQPNVALNTVGSPKHGLYSLDRGQKVAAVPLCWGCDEDEQNVKDMFQRFRGESASKRKKKKNTGEDTTSSTTSLPDLVIIGDVAYQHKPGAPSHFDALLSTLLEFAHEDTIVLFGTRIRMPASTDLLYMILEHFDELLPPLTADEVEPMFAGVKHNMTIHFMKRKRS